MTKTADLKVGGDEMKWVGELAIGGQLYEDVGDRWLYLPFEHAVFV